MLRLVVAAIVAMTLPAHAGATRLVLKTTAGTAPASVTLRCDPAGGTHPKAARACADLTGTNGGFLVPERGRRACFMIYSPVTASADGTWQGRNVHFHSTFPNACALRAKTGSIFDF